MDPAAQVREFLTSRRHRLTPDRVGLPTFGERRRVPGLRREEVATLAGVSAVYYTRLERGNLRGVSDDVLHSVARALRLDGPERDHLFDLARTMNTAAAGRRAGRSPGSPRPVGPVVRQTLDAITAAPADVRNERGDILAANPLGRALYSQVHEQVTTPPNAARHVFLDSRARHFFVDWDDVADTVVANLHGEAGRHPYDRALTALIGELSTRSDAFRVRWARHDVRLHTNGSKRLRHPVVGEIELDFQAMAIAGAEGLKLSVFTARPGSPSDAALRILASWAATAEPPQRLRSNSL